MGVPERPPQAGDRNELLREFMGGRGMGVVSPFLSFSLPPPKKKGKKSK